MQNQQQRHGAPPHISLSPEGEAAADMIAQRHGVSVGAVQALMRAMARSKGRQAQFDHPDLGGMGQWSQGGMLMVGDMFNNRLKATVASLCQDVAALLEREQVGAAVDGKPSPFFEPPAPSLHGGAWPASLGSPSSSGSQNDMRYAIFPQNRRLAIETGGKITIYDMGEHQISGVAQQQGAAGSLTLTSHDGIVRLQDLAVVSGETAAAFPQRSSHPIEDAAIQAANTDAGNDRAIFAKIEGLADLHAKNLLSDAEYHAKKAELLARL